jgi:poly-gamma-glutamate capsule biosynthesis protein CapA/YwtB (metallophosphatase superfamily)
MRKQGYDYPFLRIKDVLADADMTFANLESPLIGDKNTGRTTPGGTTVFRGDVDFATALKDAGIDMVSIANNHMKDQGAKGVTSTLKVLGEAGIAHAGAGENLSEARRIAIFDIPSKQDSTLKPLRVGVIAYNDTDVVPPTTYATDRQSGTNTMDMTRLKQDIVTNRAGADLLIISMHSGTEYAATANKHQTDFAHAAIDAGADMVIGHHPHVLQPIEVYKGKYIFYSLGNFVFDQPWPYTKQSVLAHINITAKSDKGMWIIQETRPFLLPLTISQFQPQPIVSATGTPYKEVMARFRFPYSFLTFGATGQQHTMLVKQAKTDEERTKGLSGTDELPAGEGLLFAFDEPGRHGFWMKDMNYPIDILWFDSQFRLVHKELSVDPSTYPHVFYPDRNALYVLETRVGELTNMSLTQDLTGELTYIDYYDKK